MSNTNGEPHLSSGDALELVDLAEIAVSSQNLGEFAERMLPSIAGIMQSGLALLYVHDSRLQTARLFQQGFPAEAAFQMEQICARQLGHVSGQADMQPFPVPTSGAMEMAEGVTLYPLWEEGACVGLVGIVPPGQVASSLQPLWDRLVRLLANAVSRLLEREETDRQLSRLNAYLTVSSMLAQSMDLHEVLEISLYSCMEVVSADAASILLLDDDKKNLHFYQVEGPAKPVLMSATFPADRGIAGSVLRTGRSEVINNVQNDPRFYKDFDSRSGFETRNMIAILLVAGEEKVGVLEVLNKANGQLFLEQDHLLLLSIAEEIAFAVRNAKVFEYVVNSYCKQRQGETSCKGCKRPLGSWTPCARYREKL